MYPDLNKFRRKVVPIFEENEEEWFGEDIMFSKEAQDRSYVGVIPDKTVSDVVDILKGMENVYARNLAALKWRRSTDGERVYERASYAYVPQGFFGKYQYHIRLWPHTEGVAVWAHYELNPLHSPRKHYAGKEWSPSKGAAWAHEQFDINTSADINGITKP